MAAKKKVKKETKQKSKNGKGAQRVAVKSKPKAIEKAKKVPAAKLSKNIAKKAAPVKTKSQASKEPVLTLDFAEVLHDLMTHGVITAPSQPLEYTIVEAPSREELIKSVAALTYVLPDGSVWTPLGGATIAGNGKWVQTLGRYE